MSIIKTFLILFVSLLLMANISFAGGDSLNKVVNRLMLKGYTTEQILEIKEYPQWPTYDQETGLLKSGAQQWISPDLSMVVIYHVKDSMVGQIVKREVLYDQSIKK